jgi:hypothetical protein
VRRVSASLMCLRNACAWQVALFDNYLIRFMLGEEVFFLPPGSINSTHVVRHKRPVVAR